MAAKKKTKKRKAAKRKTKAASRKKAKGASRKKSKGASRKKSKGAARKKRAAGRTEPKRSFFRGGEGSTSSDCGPYGSTVDACRKILTGQYRRGRKSRFGSSAFCGVGDQAQRMVRMWTDAAIDASCMWFEFLGSFMNPCGPRGVSRWICDAGCCCEEHCSCHDTRSSCEVRYDPCGDESDIEVSHRKAVDVYANLDCGGPLKKSVKIQKLVDADGNEADITTQVVPGPRSNWVRVVVDDSQGAGKFHALILDKKGKKVCGTLTVEVCED